MRPADWTSRFGAAVVDSLLLFAIFVIVTVIGVTLGLDAAQELIASALVGGAAYLGPMLRRGEGNDRSTQIFADFPAVTAALSGQQSHVTKGAFAGLTLDGASIRRDSDSTRAIYGHHATTRSILEGHVTVPASASSFLAAVDRAKAQAVAGN